MNLYNVLIAKKLSGGGGGSSTLIDKNISANGTYNASSDSADGYKKVVVNVPNPSTGTLSVTANGTYDVTNYASANVSIANNETGFIQGNLSGAYENSEATGVREYAFYKLTELTSISLPNANSCAAQAFGGCSNVVSLNLPKFERMWGQYNFSGMSKDTSDYKNRQPSLYGRG